MKHQPQLAAAAQKAAAMVSAHEAGAKPSSNFVGGSKVPSSDVSAAVNGETVCAESPATDCDPQATVSAAADGLTAVVEDQSCDQNVTKEDC